MHRLCFLAFAALPLRALRKGRAFPVDNSLNKGGYASGAKHSLAKTKGAWRVR
jgi:hypothetical protein